MRIFLLIVFSIYFYSEKIRLNRLADKYGWRVDKTAYDTYTYSERVQGKWQKITIHRAYYNGSFYPDFKSEQEWRSYPEWAQDRSEIIERVNRRLLKTPVVNEIDKIGRR